MKWELPPLVKVYEALGAIGDNRIEVFGNTAKCYSSGGGKYYSVKYNPERKLLYVNDNASYFIGYLGYPGIAFLMKKGILPFDKKLADGFTGIQWKDIHKKNKNDWEKTTRDVGELLKKKGVTLKKAENFAKKLIDAMKVLDLEKPAVLEKPPEGVLNHTYLIVFNPMDQIISDCKELLTAYKKGALGQTKMPEDAHPSKMTPEERLAYFTLPMALNYQRNSYVLWENAKRTFDDPKTRDIFSIAKVVQMDSTELQIKLMKYKLALQPNKHTATWKKIATTVHAQFGSFGGLFTTAKRDFLKLKELMQVTHKKEFPYYGPKIFNYWSWIIQEYGEVTLANSEYIDIAPDTHVTQCSVKLGVISQNEAENLTKETISERWRTILQGSKITPITMHAPLWFWSRNGFVYLLLRERQKKR